MKKILRHLYHWVRLLFKVKWIKTFYINFKTQKFKDAIKLPIFVYVKLKIYSIRGKLIIDSPIKTGMIHIGKDLDGNPVSLNPIKLVVNGILRFQGHALISGGSNITVWRGETIIGKNVCIGSGVQLKCAHKITIGEFSRIIALTTVMDTNVHYVKNIATGEIKKSTGPIQIGKNCWINSGSIVTKGTVIPDYCISARNTYLNKDYSKICSTHTLLAGSPAKPLAKDVQRIFDAKEEQRLNKHFGQNPEDESIMVTEGVYEEPTDIPYLLKLY